jgi:hypothetical protein
MRYMNINFLSHTTNVNLFHMCVPPFLVVLVDIVAMSVHEFPVDMSLRCFLVDTSLHPFLDDTSISPFLVDTNTNVRPFHMSILPDGYTPSTD